MYDQSLHPRQSAILLHHKTYKFYKHKRKHNSDFLSAMSAESVYLTKELKKFIPRDKLEDVVCKLSLKLVLRSQAECLSKQICSLRKDLNDGHAHADKLLEIMKEQNLKLNDQNQQIQMLRQESAMGPTCKSDDGHDTINMATQLINEEWEKQEASAATEVKQLYSQLNTTNESILRNDREYNATMVKINRIKLKLGLRTEATMEEVELEIEQLSKKGIKEVRNLKKQLDKEREKYDQLSDRAEELNQEKKILEMKLRNKEKALERLKAIKESKKTIAVADEVLRPFYKRRAPDDSLSIGISQRSPWKQSQPLPQIIRGSTGGDERVCSEMDNEQTCAKCNTKLDSSVYCPGCVKHVLYTKKP